MLAIKLHDGLYDDSNKPYLVNFTPETKPRSSIVYVLHQADLLAARIEFEQEWLPKLTGERKVEDKPKVIENKYNKNAKAKAMKKMANPALAELMKKI